MQDLPGDLKDSSCLVFGLQTLAPGRRVWTPLLHRVPSSLGKTWQTLGAMEPAAEDL